MLKKYNILPARFCKRLAFSILFTGLVLFSFAGPGNGAKTKTVPSWKSSFAPIKTTGSFTLKARPNTYRGNITLNEGNITAAPTTTNYLNFNSLITYQKGNTTYILPYRHKVSVTAGKSSLQAINLRVTIHR